MCDAFGPGFAQWRGQMPKSQQLATLEDVVNGPPQVSFKSTGQQDPIPAQEDRWCGCLVGFDQSYFATPCHCPEDQHFNINNIPHSVCCWTQYPEEDQSLEARFCERMVKTKRFPQIGPPDSTFVLPCEDNKNALNVVTLAADAPNFYHQQTDYWVAAG